MRTIPAVLAALCIFLQGYAQDMEALLKRLEAAKQDTVKINLLNALAKAGLEERSPDGCSYARQALPRAQKIGYGYGLAYACSNLGYCLLTESKFDSALYYFNKGLSISNAGSFGPIKAELTNRKAAAYYYKGNTDTALQYFKQALTAFELMRDSAQILKSLNNIGAISLRKGDLDDALAYFYKCLRYDEKQSNSRGIASDCDNISVILTSKKDHASALTYVKRALDIKSCLKDSLGLLKTYLNLGNIYEEKKDYEKAIATFLKGLETGRTKQLTADYAYLVNNLGMCYLDLHNNPRALDYLLKSLALKRQLGDKSGVASSLGNIGKIFLGQKNYGKAIMYYIGSYDLALESGNLEFQKNAQAALAQCYVQTGDKQKAMRSFQLMSLLQDSLYNVTSSGQVAELQIRYETEKKENANRLLQQQNAIKDLENKNNRQTLKVRNQTIFILIGGLVIAAMVVFWQLSLARIKKQKRALETERKLQHDRERISRDLHDNVGGQLSYVLFSLEGHESPDAEKRKDKSRDLANVLRQVTGNLRETIWAMNQDELTLSDLSDKLKLYARQMFSFSQVKIRFEESVEKDKALNPAFALNLFRIFQESINNVFKHARAANLYIKVSSRDHIEIEVRDDGTGFDSANDKQEGFGLYNLKKRAEDIGGKLSIWSRPGEGTTVTIIV